jgi:hypothetical protein
LNSDGNGGNNTDHDDAERNVVYPDVRLSFVFESVATAERQDKDLQFISSLPHEKVESYLSCE